MGQISTPASTRRSHATLFAVLTLAVFGYVAAAGASSPVPAGFNQVSVLGSQSVLLKKDASVDSGDIVGNDADALVTLSMATTTPAAFAVKSDNITVKNGATPFGTYFCNSLSDASGSATCTAVGVPVFATLPDFESATPSADDQSVGKNGSLTLAAGSYGALDVGKDATVTFGGGTYDFASITTGNGAQLLFDGPTRIRVAGTIHTGHDNIVGPSVGPGAPTAADVIFYVSGTDAVDTAVHFGQGAEIDANVYAPNGTVFLKKEGTLNGAMIGLHVILEADTSVTLATAFRNLPPTLSPDAITALEGGSANTLVGGATSLLANDTDPNNDNLFVSAATVSGPTNGAVVLQADGTFVYTHNGSETTIDSFVYEACDDGVAPGPLCSNATVAISITPVNDAPVAVTDSFTVDEAGTATSLDGGALSVLANDTDAEGNALAATPAAFATANGTVTINGDGTFSYTHDGSETNADSFGYEVCDNGTDTPGPLCSAGSVVVTVVPVNDPPVPGADTFTLDEGGTATSLDGGALSLLANDTDAEGNGLAATAVASAATSNGSVTISTDGTFSYTHDGSETVSDSFTYEVCDDGTDAPGPQCSTGTVVVTVTPLNETPVAVTDTFTVDEAGTATELDGSALSLLDNDTDIEGDGLTATAVAALATTNGSVTINADGTFSYTHDGSETLADNFTYEVCDDGAPIECATGQVDVTVTAVNDAPTANPQNVTTEFGLTVTLTGSDAEGDALTFSVIGGPTFGSVGPVTSTGSTTAEVAYTPPTNPDDADEALDSFTFQVDDGNGGLGSAVVIVNLIPPNSPPVTAPDAIRTTPGGTATTLLTGASSLLANDVDPEGGVLVVDPLTPVSGPSNGTVTLNANGTFSYTHANNGTHSDSFVYRACDNGVPIACTNAQVTVQVFNSSITVTMLFEGDGTVTSSPAGLNCSADCSATLASPDRILLGVTAAPDFAFAGFGGDPDCADGELSPDGDKVCTVTFVAVEPPEAGFFNLTVSKTGTGGGTIVSVPAGINCGATCIGISFPAYQRVDLIPTPDPGSVFVNWNGTTDCEDGSLSRIEDEDASCVAIFDEIVVPPSVETLTVVVSGLGLVSSSPSGILCDSTCSADFGTSSQVKLQARPQSAGGTFVGWSGDPQCVGSSPLLVVTVDAATTCTATFSP